MEVIKINVKRWTIKDKFLCPKCSKPVLYPSYECTSCQIKVKPVVNF